MNFNINVEKPETVGDDPANFTTSQERYSATVISGRTTFTGRDITDSNGIKTRDAVNLANGTYGIKVTAYIEHTLEGFQFA